MNRINTCLFKKQKGNLSMMEKKEIVPPGEQEQCGMDVMRQGV